jgi:lysophospholipase L1-like esterase
LATLFTLGETVAILVVMALLGAVVTGFFVNREIARLLVAVVAVAFLGSVGFIGYGVAQLVTAFSTTEGPVDPPDPIALAAADAKVDEVRDSVAFRLELTEDEMTAYVLDGLQGVEDNPLRSVALDVVDGTDGDPGRLDFTASFKGGGVGAEGSVMVVLEQGAVQVDLADISVGSFDMPGVAQRSLEDLVERVADFNGTLEGLEVEVQSVELGDDRMIVTGTQLGTNLLTSETLLSGLSSAAASAVDAVAPPPERLGPGVVDATTAPGNPVYVALGDSLAANVGVDRARDGYVSRFHNQLQLRDGTRYGLRNFGVSGETTGTLIRAGQLDEALGFMRSTEIAYVTIDIGANNLLGHLGSEACGRDLDDPGCGRRIDSAFAGYRPHIEVILGEIQEAAPDATVIFLTAYNPFSLGLGTQFEDDTDRALSEFNALAAAVAKEMGVLVADGFTPMQRTAGATTHMLDPAPDIHPVAIGYDILAAALLDALG